MRIFVTGGAGYIGSHTVRQLLEAGHDVWVCDNFTTGKALVVPTHRLTVCDVGDQKTITRLLVSCDIDVIMHFAALTDVGESVRYPYRYLSNNFLDTLKLFECMYESGVDRFVFSSTAAIYGVPNNLPVTEGYPQKPINPYGQSKLAAERALISYAAACGWGCAIFRYFNAAGASHDGDLGENLNLATRLIPNILRVASGQSKFIEVYGTDYPTPDGTCIRDYVHVDDIAAAHVSVLSHLKPKSTLIYNLGIGHGYSVKEIIKVVEKVTGKSIPKVVKPRRPGDPPNLIAGSHRAYHDLSWRPRYNIHDIVETAWNWHCKYYTD